MRAGCAGAQVVLVVNCMRTHPATDTDADRSAAQLFHARFNLWFVDPIAGRGYPKDAWESYGDKVPNIQAGDMETRAAPIDFLGVNYYSRAIVHEPSGRLGKIINRRKPVNLMPRGWAV